MVGRIVDKFIDQLRDQVSERGVAITVTPAARAWLAENGYKPEFGAREMGRVIHRSIKKPLADDMLFGALKDGGEAVIDVIEALDGSVLLTPCEADDDCDQLLLCSIKDPLRSIKQKVVSVLVDTTIHELATN